MSQQQASRQVTSSAQPEQQHQQQHPFNEIGVNAGLTQNDNAHLHQMGASTANMVGDGHHRSANASQHHFLPFGYDQVQPSSSLGYGPEFYYPVPPNHQHQHQHLHPHPHPHPRPHPHSNPHHQQPMAAAAVPIWIPAQEATNTDQLGLYGVQPLDDWFNDQMPQPLPLPPRENPEAELPGSLVAEQQPLDKELQELLPGESHHLLPALPQSEPENLGRTESSSLDDDSFQQMLSGDNWLNFLGDYPNASLSDIFGDGVNTSLTGFSSVNDTSLEQPLWQPQAQIQIQIQPQQQPQPQVQIQTPAHSSLNINSGLSGSPIEQVHAPGNRSLETPVPASWPTTTTSVSTSSEVPPPAATTTSQLPLGPAGTFRHEFANWAAAEAAMNSHYRPKMDNDSTFPRSDAADRAYVERITNAICDVSSTLDFPPGSTGKVPQAYKKFAEGKFRAREVQMLAWLIVKRAKDKQRMGPLVPNWQKARKAAQFQTFEGLIQALCRVLSAQKTIGKRLMDPVFVDELIDHPEAHLKRATQNKRLNTNKARQIQIGRLAMGQEEGIETTNAAAVSAVGPVAGPNDLASANNPGDLAAPNALTNPDTATPTHEDTTAPTDAADTTIPTTSVVPAKRSALEAFEEWTSGPFQDNDEDEDEDEDEENEDENA